MKDLIERLILALKELLTSLSSKPEMIDMYPWFTAAKKDVGQKEVPGSGNNPFIVDCFKYTSYHATEDSVPWCAAYICMRLAKAGFKTTNSAAAKSYDGYGQSCELREGCIVTIKHENGGRHVTMCYDPQDGKDSFLGIGGNQNDSVKISSYPKAHIVATRWPVKI